MKKYFSVILIAVAIIACLKIASRHRVNVSSELSELLESKQFFKARDVYNKEYSHLEEFDQLFFGSHINNIFNHLELSNSNISDILKQYPSQLTEKQICELLSIKLENSVKLFDYKQVVDVANILLTKHKDSLSVKEIGDYNNAINMWQPLVKTSKQEVTIYDNSDVTIKVDKIGLKNIPVETNVGEVDFLFDTGANVSVISRSMAEKLDLRVFDNSFKVSTITGKRVNASIAVAPKLRISHILITNAVFMVFDDENLSFPSLNYKINGIIGFPIFTAMGEIQITHDNHFIVPKVMTHSSLHNLAINFLNPVIHLKTTDDYIDCTLDTGADTSILYDNYFVSHKEDIEKDYEIKDLKIGGAGGGVISQKGYEISLTPVINGKKVKLEHINVFTAPIKKSNKFAGNIGQDLIGKYDKIILNFKDMFVEFK